MKTLLPISILFVCFFSCSTYQYLTISNTNAAGSGQQFVMADSILQVTYLFDSLDGRVGLVINNKSQQPVIVNWKKSSLIVNGNAVTIYDNAVPFYATSQSVPFTYPNTTGITGQAALPEGADFIPPAAVIKRYTKTAMFNIGKTIFAENEKLKKTGADYSEEKFKGRKFTENESPYKLRVYLTYLLNNNVEKTIETSFYASEIISSNFDPDVIRNIYYKNQPVIYKPVY